MRRVNEANHASELGALTVPLALVIALTATFGLGLVSLVVSARLRMEKVVRLDRDVAETALTAKAIMGFMERTNLVISTTRASLAVAVEPATRTALETVLRATVAAQNLRLTQWRTKRLTWLPHPLGPLPFTRDPPDLLGPKPLRRTATLFPLVRAAFPDVARAEVSFQNRKWEARFR